MPIRPSWHDEYWKRLDQKTAQSIRTTCPRCGSANTYYNQRFQNWHCGQCEHSFRLEGLGDKTPWWKRLFRRK